MPTFPTTIRALVVPLPAPVWAAESDYTEAGPRTGTPAASAASALQLVGAGSQTSGSDLELLISRGGFALRGEAGLVWRRSADGPDYHGCDVPSVITDLSTPEPDAGLTDAKHAHALALSSGTVLAVYQYETVSATSVSARRYSSGAWSSRITVRTRPFGSQDLRPCLLELPDGRILCLYWVDDGTDLTVAVSVSSDDGATWTVHQRYALAAPLASAITGRRLRAAYASGTICLVAETINGGAYEILQWASDDLAATFTAVGTAFNGAMPEIWAWEGTFRLGYLHNSPGSKGSYRASSSAWEAFSDYAAEVLFDPDIEAITSWSSGTAYTDGELAITMDDQGVLWGYALLVGQDHEGMVLRSRDGGATWDSVGTSSAAGTDPSSMWWQPWPADGTVYPRDYCAAAWRGQVLLIGEHTGSVRGDAIDCLHLGGHSTITMPPVARAQRDTRQVGWERTYVPWCDPVDIGYTASGAGTSAVTGDVLSVATTVGQQRYWTADTPGNEPADGAILLADVQMIQGGSVAGLACGLRVRVADATNGYEVQVRLSTTQLRLYDVHAAATLATVTLDGTTYPDVAAGVRILLALADGEVACWVCTTRTDERPWVLVHQGSVTDDSAAGGTANVVEWGHVAAAVATTESAWRQLHWVGEDYTGAQLAAGVTNPDDIFPLGLSSRPVYVADGALVRGLGGPAAVGDAWTLTADAEHSLALADLSAETSVRRVWRSTDDSADQEIAWRLDALEEAYGDASEAIWLGGCNWRTASLEYHDGTAWTSLGSLDLATGLTALPYLRRGNTITVDAASSPPGSRWLDRGELVGATVDLGSGKRRRVTRQTEGAWSATGRLPALTLDGCDGTEPTSGTCSIWPTAALIVIHHTSTTRLRQGYRLTIDAQDTVDGDLRAKYLIGQVVPFALHPDDASDREVSAPVEIVEEQDGTVYRRALGPARRRATWTWTDGVPEHWIGGTSTPSPETWTATSTATAPTSAATGAEARALQALVTELDALAQPVIAAFVVPPGPPDLVTITTRAHFFPALLEGPVAVEEVQGVEGGGDSERDGKLVRVSAIPLTELV